MNLYIAIVLCVSMVGDTEGEFAVYLVITGLNCASENSVFLLFLFD